MQAIKFADLLAPVSMEDFFARHYGREPLFIDGEEGKFAEVFSWAEFNRLVDMTTLWSDRTLKMVLDGKPLEAERYCQPGLSREGRPSLRPTPERVIELLEQGATLILNGVERLTPGIADVTDAIEMVTGGPVVCNAYCSWQAQRAFSSHFDVTDVFALHIEGSKRWRIYEGRFEHPVDDSSYNYASYPREFHDNKRGEVREELEMGRGDLLYVPRGQYHDALASSEASLHLSFGVNRTTGVDLVKLIQRSLPDVPAFRAPLPHFDDEAGHLAHLRALANSLQALLSSPDTSQQVRQFQREGAFRDRAPRLALPGRERNARFRIRPLFARVETVDESASVVTPAGSEALAPAQASIVSWILAQDHFGASDLAVAFPEIDAATLAGTLDKLLAVRAIELL